MDLRQLPTTERVSRATKRLMDATVLEIEELRPLIAEGQERGFLTVERIAGALDDVEITKEQVVELHQYLDEQGIDILGAAPSGEGGGRFARAERTEEPAKETP